MPVSDVTINNDSNITMDNSNNNNNNNKTDKHHTPTTKQKTKDDHNKLTKKESSNNQSHQKEKENMLNNSISSNNSKSSLDDDVFAFSAPPVTSSAAKPSNALLNNTTPSVGDRSSLKRSSPVVVLQDAKKMVLEESKVKNDLLLSKTQQQQKPNMYEIFSGIGDACSILEQNPLFATSMSVDVKPPVAEITDSKDSTNIISDIDKLINEADDNCPPSVNIENLINRENMFGLGRNTSTGNIISPLDSPEHTKIGLSLPPVTKTLSQPQPPMAMSSVNAPAPIIASPATVLTNDTKSTSVPSLQEPPLVPFTHVGSISSAVSQSGMTVGAMLTRTTSINAPPIHHLSQMIPNEPLSFELVNSLPTSSSSSSNNNSVTNNNLGTQLHQNQVSSNPGWQPLVFDNFPVDTMPPTTNAICFPRQQQQQQNVQPPSPVPSTQLSQPLNFGPVPSSAPPFNFNNDFLKNEPHFSSGHMPTTTAQNNNLQQVSNNLLPLNFTNALPPVNLANQNIALNFTAAAKPVSNLPPLTQPPLHKPPINHSMFLTHPPAPVSSTQLPISQPQQPILPQTISLKPQLPPQQTLPQPPLPPQARLPQPALSHPQLSHLQLSHPNFNQTLDMGIANAKSTSLTLNQTNYNNQKPIASYFDQIPGVITSLDQKPSLVTRPNITAEIPYVSPKVEDMDMDISSSENEQPPGSLIQTNVAPPQPKPKVPLPPLPTQQSSQFITGQLPVQMITPPTSMYPTQQPQQLPSFSQSLASQPKALPLLPPQPAPRPASPQHLPHQPIQPIIQQAATPPPRQPIVAKQEDISPEIAVTKVKEQKTLHQAPLPPPIVDTVDVKKEESNLVDSNAPLSVPSFKLEGNQETPSPGNCFDMIKEFDDETSTTATTSRAQQQERLLVRIPLNCIKLRNNSLTNYKNRTSNRNGSNNIKNKCSPQGEDMEIDILGDDSPLKRKLPHGSGAHSTGRKVARIESSESEEEEESVSHDEEEKSRKDLVVRIKLSRLKRVPQVISFIYCLMSLIGIKKSKIII